VARALADLSINYDEEIIMDGPVNYLPINFKKITCLIKADETVPIVSAASIYAKVKRDAFMCAMKDMYPSYGFEYHVGYGTSKHLKVLKALGPIKEVHRMSFKPLLIWSINS
jgi:ribonuclease HII